MSWRGREAKARRLVGVGASEEDGERDRLAPTICDAMAFSCLGRTCAFSDLFTRRRRRRRRYGARARNSTDNPCGLAMALLAIYLLPNSVTRGISEIRLFLVHAYWFGHKLGSQEKPRTSSSYSNICKLGFRVLFGAALTRPLRNLRLVRSWSGYTLSSLQCKFWDRNKQPGSFAPRPRISLILLILINRLLFHSCSVLPS